MNVLCRLFALLILMMWLHTGAGLGTAFGFQELVDQIWSDTNSKPRGNCRNFLVQAGPPKVLRGKTSGRDCLKHAVRAYREGDHEEAFGWILAGQCSDREARVALVGQAPKVMDYVMHTYGPKVP